MTSVISGTVEEIHSSFTFWSRLKLQKNAFQQPKKLVAKIKILVGKKYQQPKLNGRCLVANSPSVNVFSDQCCLVANYVTFTNQMFGLYLVADNSKKLVGMYPFATKSLVSKGVGQWRCRIFIYLFFTNGLDGISATTS